MVLFDVFGNLFVVHGCVQKSTYANQIQTRSSKEMAKEIDGDIQLCGPIQSLVSSECKSCSKIRGCGIVICSYPENFLVKIVLSYHSIIVIILLRSFCLRHLNTRTMCMELPRKKRTNLIIPTKKIKIYVISLFIITCIDLIPV
jgi:hypothetical protein